MPYTTGMTKAHTAAYTCLIGFDHTPLKGESLRFEPGDHVAGLPAGVARRLVAHDPQVLAEIPAKADAKKDAA